MERHSQSAAAQSRNGNSRTDQNQLDRPQWGQGTDRDALVTDDVEIFERHENHRLRKETELLTIESQFLRSTRHEANRLNREIATLRNRLGDANEEIQRLAEAEHQLRRLLTMVNNSPVGYLARRKWGFRKMVDQWL